MIEFAVLSSGSRANCIFVSDGKTRVLVDCGLSAREVSRRLSLHGIEPESIDAIVVTHEHSDHIRGVPRFAKKHSLDVYANQKTFAAWGSYDPSLEFRRREFLTGDTFDVGSLRFEPFSTSHDAADPVAFRVVCGNVALGIVTDLGYVSDVVRDRTRECDALVLESNHDLDLLHECFYPAALKHRIRGTKGHLSNVQAGELLRELMSESLRRMQILVGAHVSENSNHPEIVREELTRSIGGEEALESVRLVVANAFQSTPVFQLG